MHVSRSGLRNATSPVSHRPSRSTRTRCPTAGQDFDGFGRGGRAAPSGGVLAVFFGGALPVFFGGFGRGGRAAPLWLLLVFMVLPWLGKGLPFAARVRCFCLRLLYLARRDQTSVPDFVFILLD